ncbi:class I SAM-dependent methyltransferase [Bacillaceae bacterium]
MGSVYQGFAYVYDRLMQDAPYDRWVDYALRFLPEKRPRETTVVDLACGTGAVAIPLAVRGYRVIGIDLSEDMLAVAGEKARRGGAELVLLQQDMREWTAGAPVDAVLCFCDSLNYLLHEEDVRRTFRRVFAELREGGVFLFDVHSEYKLERVFAGQTFTWVEEDLAYIWDAAYDADARIATHELTIFVREGGVYRRFDETHRQRAYPLPQLIRWLEEAGFALLSCTKDFTEEPPDERCERIFFAARK